MFFFCLALFCVFVTFFFLVIHADQHRCADDFFFILLFLPTPLVQSFLLYCTAALCGFVVLFRKTRLSLSGSFGLSFRDIQCFQKSILSGGVQRAQWGEGEKGGGWEVADRVDWMGDEAVPVQNTEVGTDYSVRGQRRRALRRATPRHTHSIFSLSLFLSLCLSHAHSHLDSPKHTRERERRPHGDEREKGRDGGQNGGV